MTAITQPDVMTATDLPCHLVDPEVFFAEAPAEIEYAKTLCVDCPLKAECLAGALERREACGVWGGELLVNGVIVARKRPRGRPRKNPLPVVSVAPAAVRVQPAARTPQQARADKAA